MTSPQLAVSQISKSFAERKVLDKISFELEAGQRVSIQGPSGTGKTTLLRIIAGLDLPDSGKVVLNGQDATVDCKSLLQPWQRNVQLVFQDLGLWPTRTVLQNVTDARKAAGLPNVQQVAVETLTALGLQNLIKRKPAKLSGGEARRLAFARALALEPKLLLLDEPFASLDPQARHSGFDLLEQVLERSSAAVLLVTHDPEEAARLNGTQMNLSDGVLQCQ
ncbi:MAG: ATP-binding cassette domain-containing protein [Planctomycetes bacterium]|nr:ATP-binding cassette domain-containing protein [Planctomycetota bacterium]MCP4860026.1 ATP-binding cassette domain-containing protein [Planctomycetota bacterium]